MTLRNYIACFLFFSSLSARAYHAGSLFDKPPGAGGAGGLFYTGVPSEHGWTCTACHRPSPFEGQVERQPQPGLIQINLGAVPPSLLGTLKYAPLQDYRITVDLAGEHNAMGQRANYNGIAATFVDGKNLPAGTLSGFAPDDLYQGGPATIADAGKKPNNTSWTFTWTAPPAGTGKVTLYLGAVDGNDAGVTTADSTLTDPFGDDVFVGDLSFDEGTMASRRRPTPFATGAVGLAIVLLWWRRRT